MSAKANGEKNMNCCLRNRLWNVTTVCLTDSISVQNSQYDVFYMHLYVLLLNY